MQEIIGFTGWTLFGQLTTVFRNQAVTVLINQFFNPVVVAARAIAVNITNQISIFSNNFNTGLYPPIIKSYASDDKEQMFSLIYNGSKITFFLMWVFALPFFLEMETVLNIWLKNPPNQAILYTRLALVEVLISSISLPIATAARAPGKMKLYESILGFIQILIFIASWILLFMGEGAYIVFVVAIVANLIMFVIRLIIVKNLIGLSLRPYFKIVILPVLVVILLSLTPSFTLHLLLPKGLLYTAITLFFSVLISCVCMFYIGLDKLMQNKLKNIIQSRLQKLF